MTVNIGTRVELETLIDTRMLICANSGGGKSYAIRKLLEETHGKTMAIILDIEGEFHTLREKYDFLLIGGKSGDVEISAKSCKLLPKKLMELKVPTIIDLSDLKFHDRILYVRDFIHALMELPREYWMPTIIVIDEGHIFAGQQEKQESYTEVIDLATRGRKRGYCAVICTQRIAKLHKDVAAELNNYLVGRTGLDIDMKRASEILGFSSKQDMLKLRDLEPGEFFCFGPAIAKAVTKIKIAEVKTTHPKVGMRRGIEISPPTDKIRKMLTKLADLPKAAEEELKTMADMKKKILELKSELRKSKNISGNVVEKSQIHQLEQKYKQSLSQLENRHKSEIGKLNTQLKNMINGFNSIGNTVSKYSNIEVKKLEVPSPVQKKVLQVPVRASIVRSEKHAEAQFDSGEALGRCERKIYSFLYANPDREFKKGLVGAMTGYSHKSGGFNNAVCRLGVLGLITRIGDTLKVSEMRNDLIDGESWDIKSWLNKLDKCPKEIFKFLLQNPSSSFTKEEIGDQTNYVSTSGGFNNALCRLNSLKLITKTREGIKINEEMLEFYG